MTFTIPSWMWVLLGVAAVALLWRRHRAVPEAPLTSAPQAVLAQTPWHDVLGALAPLLAGVPSRIEAVQALGRVLRAELGAQELRVLQVHEVGEATTTVQGWSDEPLLPVPIEQVSLNQSPLGVAIHRGGVVLAGEGGFALAWPQVALTCAHTRLTWPAEGLQQLLTAAHAMVSLATAQASAHAVAAATVPVKRLPEPQRLSQQLIECLPASMFLFEPDELRLLNINQEAEREFVLDRAKVVGRTLLEAFGAAATQVAEPRMREALTRDGVVECDYAWTNRLGPRVLQVRHRALRDPQGQPLLLLVVARDVTAERQTRNDLQEAQNRFLEFSQALDDSLFITNPERTEFHFLAGSAFEVWGVTPEQAANGGMFTHVLPEDRHLLDERLACERSLAPASFVFRVRHPSRGLIAVRTRSRTIVMPDGSLRVYGVVSDVTQEQAQQEQLLAARDAAQAASLAKSQFMANMSHEIRTPMNGILGMTELLLNTPLDERQRDFAHAVYRSGESLLATLDDVLDYAKLDAGNLELGLTDFVVRTVVEDTLELLAPQAHQKRLELVFREAPGTPTQVRGDAHRLRQVLLKLVANGIKFTHAGEVVVDLQRLPADGPGWWLEFSVRDTGIGIGPDVLPRLFTAFTQAHSGLSREHDGVGLGLAIAGRLIEVMGGKVQVSSTQGEGSVFTFTVPFEQAQAAEDLLSDAEPSQTDPEAGLSGPLRVLLVEDHATSRQVLQQMLLGAGMQVTAVENGQQALNTLRESESSPHPFDVALVDIHMPQLDGISMGRVLKQDSRHRQLKLILMSASASADDVRQAQHIGFQGFLSKPVRQAELRQLMAHVGRGSKERLGAEPRLRGRVLVVEDNVVNQEVIGQMLRKLHLDVRMAGSALQGLRALCEHVFDLVLMDIMMPGMDGIEALRWFREGSDEQFKIITPRTTPVVAVTANALEGDEARFLALGFNGYLSKPLRQSQLVHMLSKHLPLYEDGRSHATAPATSDLPTPPAFALDQSALNRLKELDPRGENHLIERVIGAFQTSVARLVPQLEEAHRAGDLSGVRHVAHTFKSSSASIGATELSQRCTELETLIRQDQVDNLDERVEGIRKEIALVSQALQTLLDRQT
ncbi:MAG: response regulator [Pseudomonadota bacterium]